MGQIGGFPPISDREFPHPASVLVVPQAEEDQECELLIMDDKAYNSGGLSASKSENERAGTSSRAFQLETQKMMQPATEHFGDKRTAVRSASGQVSAPLDRKVEPKSMNPLQLHRWSAQPLAIDSPTSDYGSGTFVSLEQTGESLKEPATESQTNVESAVPTVGENVEVISVEESEKELMRPEGGIKRAAKAQLSRDKIPRVGDFIVMQGVYVHVYVRASVMCICVVLCMCDLVLSVTRVCGVCVCVVCVCVFAVCVCVVCEHTVPIGSVFKHGSTAILL